MATKRKDDSPASPSDPDTLIRELRALGERHGWGATGSSVDDQGAVVVSFAVPKDEEDQA